MSLPTKVTVMKKQETVVYCLEKYKNIEIVFMIEVWSDGWKLRVDIKDFRADQGKEMAIKGNIAQYCPRFIGWPLGQDCLKEMSIYSRRLPETAVQGHCRETETEGNSQGRGDFPVQMMSLNSNGGILWIRGLWRTVTVYGFL